VGMLASIATKLSTPLRSQCFRTAKVPIGRPGDRVEGKRRAGSTEVATCTIITSVLSKSQMKMDHALQSPRLVHWHERVAADEGRSRK
jgi:hypothetical protein